MSGVGTNWAGNYTYRARVLHRPSTLEQLRETVAAARRIRVIGSRHSFTDICDSTELVTLDGLPPEVTVDGARQVVSLTANVTYGELARALVSERVALANMASLPHISVAGAIATATHGSGDRNGNLATAVTELELIRPDGELVTLAAGEPDFNGSVVGLGALGVAARITLAVEPEYEVRQRVFEGLRWEELFEHFDAIMGGGYSVSVFTRWGSGVDQVWVKSRADESVELVHDELFGASAARTDRHPIAGLDPANCTRQLGVPGPWFDRLPHFRLGFMPSAGAEIQSEYLVPRRQAVAAIEAVLALAETIKPLVQVSEIRTVAADELWMSPQYKRDSVGIHFTWVPDEPGVRHALLELERALAPFAARPHWGKLFLGGAGTPGLYERHHEFAELVRRTDPSGKFVNEWLDRLGLTRSGFPPA